MLLYQEDGYNLINLRVSGVTYHSLHLSNWGEREEPHTSELAGGFSICMYVRYVRDSVYLYDLFKRRPAPGLGMRSTGMGKRSRAYFLLLVAH